MASGAAVRVEMLSGGPDYRFQVVVREGDGETRHEVRVAQTNLERLAGRGADPLAVVEAAFRFLLEREPKEAILGRFELTIISRYFPDFPRLLPRYLGR